MTLNGLGNWRRSHEVWRSEKSEGFTRSGDSYLPLAGEREKMSSYPVIEIIMKMTKTVSSALSPPTTPAPLALPPNARKTLVSWPTQFNVFAEESHVTVQSDITSSFPMTPTVVTHHGTPSSSQSLSFLSLSSRVFSTITPLFSPAECRWVIGVAEQEALKRSHESAAGSDGWTTSRHYAVPTTDLPIQQIPELLTWFNQAMVEKIGPLLAAQLIHSKLEFFVLP
jgi:hypothetical protein